MGRVDKYHKGNTKKSSSRNNASMNEILGKNASKVKKKNGKKKKKKNPVNRILVITAVLLVLSAAGYFLMQFLTAGSSSSIGFIPKTEKFNNGELTMLMLGSDGRNEVSGERSDTIIVGRFNFKEGYVRMISIPRDTVVDIEGHNKNKINAAYAFGGSELTKKTIENFYGIKIDKTMEVSFDTFISAVDKLGGVEIFWEDEPLVFKPYKLNIQPGVNKLTADIALNFVRFRGTPTADLGRVSRQQLFLKSLAKDIKNKANIIQQLDTISDIYKGVKTDLSLSEMVYMFNKYKEFDNFNIVTWMSASTLGHSETLSSVLIPDDNIDQLAKGFLDGSLVVSKKKEGTIFPELITLEEKAIEDQKEAKIIADKNAK